MSRTFEFVDGFETHGVSLIEQSATGLTCWQVRFRTDPHEQRVASLFMYFRVLAS